MAPLKPRDIPNVITILRIFLVIPVVWALLDGRYTLALWLFAVAGASDGLDGFLAKQFHWTSRLGAILDPLADKLLLVSTFVALGWQGLLPLWLVAVVLGRDVVIVAGAVAYHLLFGSFELHPTLISKVNTFCQILLVILTVVRFASEWDLLWMVHGMTVLVLLTTLSNWRTARCASP